MSPEEKINECHKALFGNGEPEECILTRLGVVEGDVKKMMKWGAIGLTGIIALVGNLVVSLVGRMGQ